MMRPAIVRNIGQALEGLEARASNPEPGVGPAIEKFSAPIEVYVGE